MAGINQLGSERTEQEEVNEERRNVIKGISALIGLGAMGALGQACGPEPQAINGGPEVIKPGIPTIDGQYPLQIENLSHELTGEFDVTNTAGIEISTDGGNTFNAVDSVDTSAGTWNHVLTFSAVGETQTIVIKGVGPNGEQGDVSNSATVEIVDLTAPEAPTLDTTPVVLTLADSSFTKEVTVSDDTTRIRVYYDDGQGGEPVLVHEQEKPNGQANVTVNVTAPKDEANGEWGDGTYIFTALDDSGNEGAGTGVEVGYEAPTVSIDPIDCSSTGGWCAPNQVYTGYFNYDGAIDTVNITTSISGAVLDGEISNITYNNGTGSFSYQASQNGSGYEEAIMIEISGPGGTVNSSTTHWLI